MSVELKHTIRELTDQLFEGNLSEMDRHELEQIILSDPDVLREFAAELHDQAGLVCLLEDHPYLNTIPSSDVFARIIHDDLNLTSFEDSKVKKAKRFLSSSKLFWSVSLLMISAIVSISLFFLFDRPSEFATLLDCQYCYWGDCNVSTLPNSRLGKARFILKMGVARIAFDSDVSLVIEAPAKLEIRGPKECYLEEGCCVVNVLSDLGKGFMVETAKTKIYDLGTSFAVAASNCAETQVQVLKGEVDLYCKKTNRTIRMEEGDDFFSEQRMMSVNSNKVPERSPVRILQFTSAMGRGNEEWLVRNPERRHFKGTKYGFDYETSEKTFMLVKNALPLTEEFDRKALFSIDLNVHSGSFSAAKTSIQGAKLLLSYGNTNIGYRSNVPDAVFSVYGRVQKNENEEIKWENTPSIPNKTSVDSERMNGFRLIGKFMIPQAKMDGIVSLDSPELLSLVREDPNGLLAFCIVRDTQEKQRHGYTHGFANRYHPVLSPPRLQLKIEDKGKN